MGNKIILHADNGLGHRLTEKAREALPFTNVVWCLFPKIKPVCGILQIIYRAKNESCLASEFGFKKWKLFKTLNEFTEIPG